MSIIEAPWMYAGIFAVFLVVVYFVSKFNQKLVDRRVGQAKKENRMPELAAALGLSYEDLTPQEKGKKEIYNVGSRVYGNYQHVPLEMVMASRAVHSDGVAIAYSYTMERRITLTVKNPSEKSLEIRPKDNAVVAEPTICPPFNEKLTLTGTAKVPREFLDYCAGLGWMNLKLKGDRLTFIDDYYDQFQGVSGGLKMMNAVHPVWGTSVKDFNRFEISRIRDFIDHLVGLAKGLGLTATILLALIFSLACSKSLKTEIAIKSATAATILPYADELVKQKYPEAVLVGFNNHGSSMYRENRVPTEIDTSGTTAYWFFFFAKDADLVADHKIADDDAVGVFYNAGVLTLHEVVTARDWEFEPGAKIGPEFLKVDTEAMLQLMLTRVRQDYNVVDIPIHHVDFNCSPGRCEITIFNDPNRGYDVDINPTTGEVHHSRSVTFSG